ncbi:MAG: hypothetical protein AVDCRST_MAG37-3247, partial [uncultured Rubrobacteraceae bacterium]
GGDSPGHLLRAEELLPELPGRWTATGGRSLRLAREHCMRRLERGGELRLCGGLWHGRRGPAGGGGGQPGFHRSRTARGRDLLRGLSALRAYLCRTGGRVSTDLPDPCVRVGSGCSVLDPGPERLRFYLRHARPHAARDPVRLPRLASDRPRDSSRRLRTLVHPLYPSDPARSLCYRPRTRRPL